MWLRRLALALALTACASSSSTPAWRSDLAAADRAHHAGRDREAAALYDRAAASSIRDHDRDEALWRAAHAWRAVGDTDAALARFDAVAARSSEGERGPRAMLDGALLRVASANASVRDEGWRALDALVRRWPASGPARRAVSRVLAHLDDEDPAGERALAWITDVRAVSTVTGTALVETLEAERALRLARMHREEEAIAAWRALFAAVPYPQNSRWDDGHMALAGLLRAKGDARGAVAALDEMLSLREPTCLGGSCDAPMFQEGAMLRGEILRDDLRDLAGAAEAYRATYEMFPLSRVRDDALYEEARVRETLNDGRACAVWAQLAREFGCTRRGREGIARARGCGIAVPPPSGDDCG